MITLARLQKTYRQPRLTLRQVRYQSTGACSITSSRKIQWLAFGLATSAIAGSGIYWTSRKSTLEERASLPLFPTYFSPTKISYSEKTSETTKIIKLALPPAVAASLDNGPSIWSIYVKDSDIQVERPYTPLEGLSEDGTLLFWIRKYPHGEVGRWLHSKLVGDQIEIRGPEQTWAWKVGTYDNIIMLAGGTGVAPFYQLLHHHFSKRKVPPEAKFTLIHGHRNTSELPPTQVMDQLQSWERSAPESLRIYNLVDSLGSVPRSGALVEGRISEDLVRSVLKTCKGRTMVLVCGPDCMVNALAGPKARDQSQGHLGGILARLKTNSIDVWKL